MPLVLQRGADASLKLSSLHHVIRVGEHGPCLLCEVTGVVSQCLLPLAIAACTLCLPDAYWSLVRAPCVCLMLSYLQVDPSAADDGAGDLSSEKLWHQQHIASGFEHTPLGAAAESGNSEAAVKVGTGAVVDTEQCSRLSRCCDCGGLCAHISWCSSRGLNSDAGVKVGTGAVVHGLLHGRQ